MPIDPQLTALLQRHGLSAASPVLYVGPGFYSPPRWPTSDAMPTISMPDFTISLITLLPTARQELYLRRFASDGHPTTGYLVFNTIPGDPTRNGTTLFTPLEDVYTDEVVDQNSAWVLRRFYVQAVKR